MNKKLIKNLIIVLLLATFVGVNFVYAETVTSGEILFCDYAGTRKALKAVGIAITIAKIFVPLILIAVTIIDLFKCVLSGKSEDLVKEVPTAIKRLIAGFVVFIVPTLVLGTYQVLDLDPEGTMEACFTCTLDPNSCDVTDGDDKDTKAQNTTVEKSSSSSSSSSSKK